MESVCKREDMPAITTLAYKRNFREVLPRLQSLYGRAAGDRLFATMDVPNAALARFAESHAAAACSDPDLDERTRFWDELLSHRAAVNDDSMPVAYLSETRPRTLRGSAGGRSAIHGRTPPPVGFPRWCRRC